ncbi:MAG: cysteine desulfurase [Candidatus Methanoperedens sp.]|nr:cysteine desulfurase [Candidatus Methanoperedens sp.]MCE8424985.1 cysteine desulfurase [Candidatus Methanoperedens sp.]MCE8427419.1 cysteine desulfurase [Candidatus Methanoperedens sp.]
MKQVYMDYGSASPVDERVIELILPFFNKDIGNPSSLHSQGIKAKRELEAARKIVADLIGAQNQKSITFTSGATESNNLALRGAALRYKDKGNHIITTSIEHMSVMNTLKDMQRNGFEVTHIPVDRDGLVNTEQIKNAITDKTILISVMYANGEIGTIQPIKEIGEIASDKKILFHVDGTAAVGKVPIDVDKEHIDMMTISSNDMLGPKGIGALYVKQGVRFIPFMLGGGQESGMRSGSENIPGIIGMGKAAELAQKEMIDESAQLMKLRDRLIENILKTEYTYLTGHRTKRLPNNASFRFSFIEGESIILQLNDLGITASTGSACSTKTLEPSHVLIAMGLRHEEAHGSLLLTLGRYNTEGDVDHVIGSVPAIVGKLRALSPLYPMK